MAASRPARTLLLFDGSCGPCRAFARAVRALDTEGRLELVPLQDEAARGRFEPLLGAAYWESFHLVGPGGGPIRSGAPALGALARLLPAVRPFVPLAFETPLVRRLPGALYAVAALARSCALPPAHG